MNKNMDPSILKEDNLTKLHINSGNNM